MTANSDVRKSAIAWLEELHYQYPDDGLFDVYISRPDNRIEDEVRAQILKRVGRRCSLQDLDDSCSFNEKVRLLEEVISANV